MGVQNCGLLLMGRQGSYVMNGDIFGCVSERFLYYFSA